MPDATPVELGTSKPEVEQTPRQRVEASFREREQTVDELNLVNLPGSSKWGWEWTPERLAEERRLKQQLETQIKNFQEKIVSNLPEAEAWVEIEKDNLIRTRAERGHQLMYGATPTDKAYARIQIGMAEEVYTEAVSNLKNIRERNTTTVPTS